MAEIPADCRPDSLAEAYAVQAAVHTNLTAAGWGSISGHKIGCTTTVMQEYLKIDAPCAGGVFEKSVRLGEGHYDLATMCRPGVECEIAVRLAADLPGRDGGHSHDTVSPAVAAAMASIELVDDRWQDFTVQPMTSLLADEFFGAGCVLGDGVTDWRELDLAAIAGRMTINGNEVGAGVGGDILGHPLNALVWLADLRAARGQSLRAGEFVTLGSLVQTVWIDEGDEVIAEIDGLGRAVLRL
ncbi:MAG: sulfate adenylyltransferase [Rhodospirillaceae bacterium]|nr:sulfate adenylyltransferase [Rhodospirillaceae bacterium]MBT5895951.1 sulfate adenylyltransferase [Rhodospirillaceae bacterium]MBT6428237.1 sulfate adenylyltransferase [Rhodospirillaceae bacterium]MBT7756365.1 sulfate adenylyltransferase [Rhodospirillaceae bacterium]